MSSIENQGSGIENTGKSEKPKRKLSGVVLHNAANKALNTIKEQNHLHKMIGKFTRAGKKEEAAQFRARDKELEEVINNIPQEAVDLALESIKSEREKDPGRYKIPVTPEDRKVRDRAFNNFVLNKKAQEPMKIERQNRMVERVERMTDKMMEENDPNTKTLDDILEPRRQDDESERLREIREALGTLKDVRNHTKEKRPQRAGSKFVASVTIPPEQTTLPEKKEPVVRRPRKVPATLGLSPEEGIAALQEQREKDRKLAEMVETKQSFDQSFDISGLPPLEKKEENRKADAEKANQIREDLKRENAIEPWINEFKVGLSSPEDLAESIKDITDIGILQQNIDTRVETGWDLVSKIREARAKGADLSVKKLTEMADQEDRALEVIKKRIYEVTGERIQIPSPDVENTGNIDPLTRIQIRWMRLVENQRNLTAQISTLRKVPQQSMSDDAKAHLGNLIKKDIVLNKQITNIPKLRTRLQRVQRFFGSFLKRKPNINPTINQENKQDAA